MGTTHAALKISGYRPVSSVRLMSRVSTGVIVALIALSSLDGIPEGPVDFFRWMMVPSSFQTSFSDRVVKRSCKGGSTAVQGSHETVTGCDSRIWAGSSDDVYWPVFPKVPPYSSDLSAPVLLCNKFPPAVSYRSQLNTRHQSTHRSGPVPLKNTGPSS